MTTEFETMEPLLGKKADIGNSSNTLKSLLDKAKKIGFQDWEIERLKQSYEQKSKEPGK